MTKVLVIAEYHHDVLSQGTKSTINAALKLGDGCDVLVLCAKDTISETVSQLQGVNTVKIFKHPCFSHILGEDAAQVVVEIAKEYSHILAPASTFGKNFLPRVAAMLDVGQISDVCAIEDTDIFVRPIYAGNAFEKVQSLDAVKVLSIRSTAFEPVTQSGTKAKVVTLNSAFEPIKQVQFKHEETPTLTRPELTAAKIIVSGGRGFKSKDNFKMIESLADKLGAAIGASRAAVDAGFVPNDFQVGQTGKVVAPDLYIAIGISGAIQHLAGMKDSKVIVAINKDPEAPIFQLADYGLVGDLFTLVPALEQALKKDPAPQNVDPTG